MYEIEQRTKLVEDIGRVLGDMNETDYANFDKFAERAIELGDLATKRGCKLYVDAEQTFI